MRRAKAIIPALFLLAACGSVRLGQEFDPSVFEAKVQRGTTKQAEVRAWLGAPAGVGISVEISGERYEQWTYYYGEGHLPNLADARLKLLQIKFDQQGVVRSYTWSGELK